LAAFCRRKTSRWFVLTVNLLFVLGWSLNQVDLSPAFSFAGYESDWRVIGVLIGLATTLLGIFGNVKNLQIPPTLPK
jgi:hypothetical protein